MCWFNGCQALYWVFRLCKLNATLYSNMLGNGLASGSAETLQLEYAVDVAFRVRSHASWYPSRAPGTRLELCTLQQHAVQWCSEFLRRLCESGKRTWCIQTDDFRFSQPHRATQHSVKLMLFPAPHPTPYPTPHGKSGYNGANKVGIWLFKRQLLL